MDSWGSKEGVGGVRTARWQHTQNASKATATRHNNVAALSGFDQTLHPYCAPKQNKKKVASHARSSPATFIYPMPC